jgi:hypothetical protein
MGPPCLFERFSVFVTCSKRADRFTLNAKKKVLLL